MDVMNNPLSYQTKVAVESLTLILSIRQRRVVKVSI